MIKKLVIPQAEVKWVCELSKEEYGKFVRAGQRMIDNLFKEFIQPIADYEVSVEDVKDNNIYACCFFNEIYKLSYINLYYFFININMHSTLNGETVRFKDLIIATTKLCDVYEFSGENKQQEFFEWALKQLGGN